MPENRADNGPVPPPSPANAFAGIHWTVNQIENVCMQAYWADEAQWDAIHAELATCLARLMELDLTGKDGCPWPPCGTGCKPVCDD